MLHRADEVRPAEPDRVQPRAAASGHREPAGADGWYVLTEVDGGTRLEISLTMHVDLPLAKAARPAVTRVMRSMMQRTGDRFATNLLRHLKVPA